MTGISKLFSRRRSARRPSAANSPRYWREAQAETPLAGFIPFSSMLTPHDVITRGGDYMRTWRLDGVPFECTDEHIVAQRHEAKCNLYRALSGGQFAIWEHRVHRHIEDALSVPEEPGFARDLALAHQRSLGGGRMMSSELYLTLLYRPNQATIGRVLRGKRTPQQIARDQQDALTVMAQQTALVERVLHEFDPQLLGTYEHKGRDYSEMREFLHFLVNGKWQRMPYKAGPLYRSLPTCRMFFGGNLLEIRHGAERRYAALVDIKEYAEKVSPGSLDCLLYEGSEFIETQSFSPLPRRDAIAALELQQAHLLSTDDVTRSQIEEMDQALNDLGNGDFCLGEYHYSLVVFGADVDDAALRAARAIGAISEATSMEMAPVDLVADAAWFAQMPANWQWRPRKAMLTSRAYAALACGHNFSRGKRDGNPWGEALALLHTPSGQPFYINLHKVREGANDEDKKLPGNTLVIGSTGTGKTTLVMFLLAMTRKWTPAPRLVVFDLDRGGEIAIRAMRGRYFALKAGVPTGCNPLQRDPTPKRLQFWERLVRVCLEGDGIALTPIDLIDVSKAVAAVARMPAALRRMSTVRQNLPKKGENSLHLRLGRWCQGGTYGWVFDESDDRLTDLSSASVVGFDYTEFVDIPEVRTPLMLYLLDVMGELINGERLIYDIAEAWKALGHEAFSDFMNEEQKTIRKKNGLGMFDTQSPSDILRSAIGRTMIEQSATKIFTGNRDAVESEYMDGFGLTRAEFETVVSLGINGSHQILVKQGHSSAVCELDLDCDINGEEGTDKPTLRQMVNVLSGSEDNVVLLDEIRARVGDDPDVWLPMLLQAIEARKTRNERRAA